MNSLTCLGKRLTFSLKSKILIRHPLVHLLQFQFLETLDLLQDILGDYDGTVLLVSHDRDFIDRVATTTVALEGNAKATVYPGGWSDYAAQRGAQEEGPVAQAPRTTIEPPKPIKKTAEGLTFTEKKRLDTLPGLIARMEAEIAKLNDLMSDPELYRREPVKFQKASDMLTERQEALAAAEEEWLDLSDRT